MKLTFLGSGHGVPTAERHCSSLMVETGGNTYIIDTGAPLMDCLLRHGKLPADVKAIFYTHAHGDHVSGVLSFLDLVHWYYKNDSVDIYAAEQRTVDGVTAYLKALFGGSYAEERIRFQVVPSDFVYEDGTLKITYIPTKHINGGERPSYAMLLEAEGKRVIVTGDLSQGLKADDFPRIALTEETDLVISEFVHFGLSAITPYLEQCKTKQLWFTHVGEHHYGNIETIKNNYPYPIYLAHDDDEIDL